MGKRLAIAMFVDACGWDVVASRPWFMQSCFERRSVKSIFGFSSACVPSILTGRMPRDNDHWSSFYYSPTTSPFGPLKLLSHLPGALVDRGRVRHLLSKAIASAYGYTGYFQIYNLPFGALPLFDYAEKRDIFVPGGINRGTSIFDDLVGIGIAHHVADWRAGEAESFASLGRSVREGTIQFAFMYTSQLDALMHAHTRDSALVDERLRWYESQLREVLRDAYTRYDEVRVAVFSDHGMATVRRVVNLMPRVARLGLRYGRDYAAVYDSTMMRFWFLRSGARERIVDALEDARTGRWLETSDLSGLGVWWPDNRFGDAVFALEPGVLLNPSHMGTVPVAGMHGYRPEDPDSDAALLTDFTPSTPVEQITELYGIMHEMALWSSRG